MRTILITSCTGAKRYSPSSALTFSDFTSENLAERVSELCAYKTRADLMYTGMQHVQLMAGVKILQDFDNTQVVDVAILSAGYGLIMGDKTIVPYNVTFNTMNTLDIKNWSRRLKIRESIINVMSKYDLIIFLLGSSYLKSIEFPLPIVQDQTVIFFTSPASDNLIPKDASYYKLFAGLTEAKQFAYSTISLKGYLFKLVAMEVAHGNCTLQEIKDKPEIISSVISKYGRRDGNNKLFLIPDLSQITYKVIKK